MKISKQEYEYIMQDADVEAKRVLQEVCYYDLHKEKNIYKIEIIVWDLAKKYVNREISPEVFNSICSYFNEGDEFYQMSGWAQDLISTGTEINYYLYQDQDSEELLKIQNFIKLLIKKHFANNL